MRRRKWLIRLVAVVMALLLVGSVLFGVISSLSANAAASQSALNNLQAQQDELDQKKQELQSQINSLEYEQSTALAKKSVLDAQIELTQEEIGNITEQIDTYTQLVADKADEVEAAQVAEDEQWELYKTRMRAMEENGTITYIAVIFKASSFSDLLARLDIVGEVMEYDESLFRKLDEARLATIEAKEDLENTKTEREDSKVELIARQAELTDRVAEADNLLEEIESNIDEFTALYEEAESDEDAVQKEINKMMEELKNQESGSVTSTGSFIWPTPSSHIVTSLFGMRQHPIDHVLRMHTGVDIGASYGASILASDGGKVLTSKYSSSYGNYIVINHGNGTTSLYAHLSSRKVSAGDSVTQGQVIGLVGSTGNSTGPHLHFEISKNGTRVNPLDYFSGYTIQG